MAYRNHSDCRTNRLDTRIPVTLFELSALFLTLPKILFLVNPFVQYGVNDTEILFIVVVAEEASFPQVDHKLSSSKAFLLGTLSPLARQKKKAAYTPDAKS